MRYVMFVLTTWLAVSAFAQSVERGSVAQMADPQARLDMLVERLNLSAEQADAIAPILAEEGIKRRELMAEARSQGPQAVRERMMDMQVESDARFADHLSVDQMAALQTMRDEEGARRRERMGGRTRSDLVSLEVGQMIPNLELVDDQGNPARLRELTRGHYTSMTLGCLT